MITIKGIYGREMFETWYAMSALLRSGLDISSVITHRFAADDWEEAFATARGGQCGKVVLDWTVVYDATARCTRPNCSATLDEIRAAGLYKNERQLGLAAVGARQFRAAATC